MGWERNKVAGLHRTSTTPCGKDSQKGCQMHVHLTHREGKAGKVWESQEDIIQRGCGRGTVPERDGVGERQKPSTEM